MYVCFSYQHGDVFHEKDYAARVYNSECVYCLLVRDIKKKIHKFILSADLFTPLFVCQYFGQKLSVIQGVVSNTHSIFHSYIHISHNVLDSCIHR